MKVQTARRLSRFGCILALVVAAIAHPADARDAVTAPRPPSMEQALANAFEDAQLASLSQSNIALNAIAARVARGVGPIAELERKRETLEASHDEADAAYEAALAGDGADATARRTHAAALRDQSARDLVAVAAAIKAQDPAYWDLVRPDALPLKAVQQLLNPDEALLLVFTFETATYSFALTAGGATWHRSTVFSETELAKTVNTLRSGIVAELFNEVDPGKGFVPAQANTLYRELIAPLEPALAGKTRLLTVVSGPLAALPLQALATNAPPTLDDAQWLADRYRISSLTSVAMLRSMRCLLVPQDKRHPGCGPSGTARPERGVAPAGSSMLLGFGDPVLGPPLPIGKRGGNRVGTLLTRGMADRSVLMTLPSLPGTRAELDSVSGSFGLTKSRLLLGTQASETNVRAMVGQVPARFIVFSTHGLLSSETGVLAEPGLVLTPPAAVTDSADDGFLAASEVAEMKLAGATVILSACNTATVEGGVSTRNLQSLARAFQFAGARNVMATHWSVSDDSTPLLMGNLFRLLAGQSGLAEDEALQRAGQELRKDARWRSPAFWAPFSIIGVP